MVEIILDLIKKSGITNNKLLSDLNLPSSAITEWKKGKAKPSVDALMKIADYFDCSVDYLLGREKHTDTNPQIIPYDGENPKIYEIEKLSEQDDLPDEVINFIWDALKRYKK